MIFSMRAALYRKGIHAVLVSAPECRSNRHNTNSDHYTYVTERHVSVGIDKFNVIKYIIGRRLNNLPDPI